MVKVLRVETDVKLGMYGQSDLDCIWDMQSPSNHPLPNEDAALSSVWNDFRVKGIHREWSFGFSDLKQLRNWIYRSEWRDELARTGFMISVYDAKDYHLGDTQCIFKLKESNLVDRFGFDEIYTKEI